MIRLVTILFFVMLQTGFSQWEPCNNGFVGADINALVVVGDTVLAGTWAGGIFKSTDNGNSWHLSNKGLTNEPNKGTVEIIDLIRNGNQIIASTSNYIFISTDFGTSWVHKKNNFREDYIRAMCASGDTILINTYFTFLISYDNGESWQKHQTGMENMFVTTIVKEGDVIYAGRNNSDADTNHGIYISKDFGLSWIENKNGISTRAIRSIAANGNNVYAAADSCLYISRDKGKSWAKMIIDSNALYLSSIIATDSSVIIGNSSKGMLVSSDGGVSWESKGNALRSLPVTSIVATGDKIYAGTMRDGVYISKDKGLNFERKNSGLSSVTVTSLTSHAGEMWAEVSIGSSFIGMYLSTNKGDSWTPNNMGFEKLSISSLYIDKDVRLLCPGYSLSGEKLFMSTDQGKSWDLLDSYLKDNSITGIIYGAAKSGNNLIISNFKGIYLSSDRGVTWSLVRENDDYSGNSLNFIASGNNIFAQNRYDNNPYDGGYIISTDNGYSWKNIDSVPNCPIAKDLNDMFILLSNTLYYSWDYGITWNTRKYETSYSDIRSIAAKESIIFASSGSYLYLSSNQGVSWTNIPVPVPYGYISKIYIVGNYVYATFRNGIGIYRAKLSDLISVEDNAGISEPIRVYPNPAGDILNITLNNGNPINKIEIVNLLGNKLIELESSEQNISVNTQSLSSGIYFLRVRGANGISTAKVLIR